MSAAASRCTEPSPAGDGDAKSRPQPLAREVEPLDSGTEDRVEKHDLAVRREDSARGVDEAVRDAGSVQAA